MPDLAAGDPVSALDWPPSEFAQDDTLFSNITVTGWTAGTPVVAVTFVANTWGKVSLAVGGMGQGGAAGTRVEIGAHIWLGTSAAGTEFIAPSISRAAIFNDGTVYAGHTRVTRLTGLTPGATYYARVEYNKEGGSTGDIIRREIFIHPIS